MPLLPIFLFGLLMAASLPLCGHPTMTWKIGTDKFKITPETPMWIAGYAHRDQPATGKYSDLWVKVVAFEDQQENIAVLLTSDLLGFPCKMSEAIRKALYQQYSLSKSQVILNSSHTHSGPVLEAALFDIYPLDKEQRQRISAYSRQLVLDIVESVGRALAKRQPSQVYAANGTARFQVNRRNNKEGEIHQLNELKGPIDHAVPVIKVTNLKSTITAVIFGYACHPTVLNHYSWSADFPGYAQETLEATHPGAMALFFQGAAGDQNPLPRRSLPLARQYGKELAAAIERVMEEKMKSLQPELRYAYQEIELSLNPPMSRETLESMMVNEKGYVKRWAKRMLKEQNLGTIPRSSYPFPVQVWKLGDQVLFAMGGESTIGYATRLKAKYGPEVFVMAYSNDVMGYIPTEVILKEGGYEGYTSQMVYGLPNSWKGGWKSKYMVLSIHWHNS